MSSQGVGQDVILVERAKGGDLDAFRVFITKYKQRIYNYCLCLLLMNQQAAEEATKNTFDKFFDSIHRLRENQKFRIYLYRIAKRECIREIKDRKRVYRDPSLEDLPAASPKCSPEEEVIGEERKKILEREISRLKLIYREIIVLIHYNEMSYEEAAKVLNIPVNTAKVYMHRAMGILKEGLKRQVRSSLFCLEDIRDPAGLAARLRAGRNPLSQDLWGQFSSDTRRLLDRSDDRHSHSSDLLQKALVDEMNRLLQGPCLFDKRRFKGVLLTRETRKLARQNPQGKDLIYLNRLLLEQAYPLEIEKKEDIKGLI